MKRHAPLQRRSPMRHGGAGRNATKDAERKLWTLLRGTPVLGLRFSRHEVIGPYVVAFFCPAAKLVLELGDDVPDAARDDERVEWLRAKGYRVLRFSNRDVMKNPQHVIAAISQMFQIQAVPETRGSNPSSKGA